MRLPFRTTAIAAAALGTAAIATVAFGVGGTSSPAAAPTTISLAEVQAHNTAADCWSVVDGKVYDLTNWVSAHPGGKAVITAMCGVDATTAFHNMHGVSGNPTATLATFQVGVLAAAPSGTSSPGATTPVPNPTTTVPSPSASATRVDDDDNAEQEDSEDGVDGAADDAVTDQDDDGGDASEHGDAVEHEGAAEHGSDHGDDPSDNEGQDD